MAEHRHRLNREVFVGFELGPYSVMVAVLVVFFFVMPFTSQGTPVNLLLNLAMITTLLSTIYFSWRSRYGLLFSIALAGVTLVPVLGLARPEGTAELAAHAAAFALMLICVSSILGSVLTAERVTLDILLGGAAVYLFIGVLWGAMFALLEYWFPGSFKFPSDVAAAAPTALLPLRRDTVILYYSFETLTTLGYGDVTPATPPARFLSILEAVFGQLYLALLVGRLVSLQLMHRRGGNA